MGIVQWEKGATHFKSDVVVPRRLEKEARDKTRKASDEDENVKVHERSKRRCEVVWFGKKARKITKCQRPSAPGVHHMIYGRGKRARGASILAEHKQDVCADCHALITSHVLKRVGDAVPLWSDMYEHQGK